MCPLLASHIAITLDLFIFLVSGMYIVHYASIILVKMFGSKREKESGGYRKLYNKKLHIL
jgi:hypothetical protein